MILPTYKEILENSNLENARLRCLSLMRKLLGVNELPLEAIKEAQNQNVLAVALKSCLSVLSRIPSQAPSAEEICNAYNEVFSKK